MRSARQVNAALFKCPLGEIEYVLGSFSHVGSGCHRLYIVQKIATDSGRQQIRVVNASGGDSES